MNKKGGKSASEIKIINLIAMFQNVIGWNWNRFRTTEDVRRSLKLERRVFRDVKHYKCIKSKV